MGGYMALENHERFKRKKTRCKQCLASLSEESNTGTENTEEDGSVRGGEAGGGALDDAGLGRSGGGACWLLGHLNDGGLGDDRAGGDDAELGGGGGTDRDGGVGEGEGPGGEGGGGGLDRGGGVAGAVGDGWVALRDGDGLRLGEGRGLGGGDVLLGGDHHGEAGGQDGEEALELHFEYLVGCL